MRLAFEVKKENMRKDFECEKEKMQQNLLKEKDNMRWKFRSRDIFSSCLSKTRNLR